MDRARSAAMLDMEKRNSMRAAFKAVVDGSSGRRPRPTTVLAMQHDEPSKRMSGFPVIVDVVSRFRTAKDQTFLLLRRQALDFKNDRVNFLVQ